MRWAPILLGGVAELIVLAAGLLLPLTSDSAVRTFFVLGLLNVGVLGGAITGVLLGGTWRSNVIHGIVTGVIGGVVFATLLFGTVTNLLSSPRYTGFWTIHYFIAVTVPIPSWVVVRYGRLVVAGISLLVGAFVLIESAIAAGAVASAGVSPVVEE